MAECDGDHRQLLAGDIKFALERIGKKQDCDLMAQSHSLQSNPIYGNACCFIITEQLQEMEANLMSTANLNVSTANFVDPSPIEDKGTWFVHILDCEGGGKYISFHTKLGPASYVLTACAEKSQDRH